MELAKTSKTQLQASLTSEIAIANNWQGLAEKGLFEQDKALLSIDGTSAEYLSKLPHKSMADVDLIPTASLATLKKYRGEEKMLAVLSALIIQSCEMLNVGKAMNEKQIANTAKLIFQEYFYFTLADFKVCFANGLKGKYGQLFDRMDSTIIFAWLAEHNDERAAYFEVKSRNSSEQFKKQDGKPEKMPEWFSEKLQAIEAKSKKPVRQTTAITQRFPTLSAFLQSIGKGDEESKETILKAWSYEFQAKEQEIELDSFFVYKSNQLLYAANLGKVISWQDVLETLELSGEEIPF